MCQVILELLSLPTSDAPSESAQTMPNVLSGCGPLEAGSSGVSTRNLATQNYDKHNPQIALFWKEVALIYSGKPKYVQLMLKLLITLPLWC